MNTQLPDVVQRHKLSISIWAQTSIRMGIQYILNRLLKKSDWCIILHPVDHELHARDAMFDWGYHSDRHHHLKRALKAKAYESNLKFT